MRRFILILSLLFSSILHSQDALQGDYLFLGIGGTKSVQLDQFHSPLHYHGYNGSVSLGWHSFKANWMSNLDASGLAGFSNPYQFGNSLNSGLDLGMRLHYSLRYRIWHKNQHQLLVGLYNQNFFNYRDLQGFRNSSESFAGLFGIGPSLAYSYSDNNRIFGKEFSWSWLSEVNIPASTIYIRPSYTRQLAGGDIGFSEHQFMGNAWQLDFRHSLIWHRSNGNQIRLNYSWEYLKSEVPTAYHYSSHLLSIQFFYQL